MDYNEIIEAMRSTDAKVVFCRSLDAALALETLLSERDAAVEDLRGTCFSCKHGNKWEKEANIMRLIVCEHMKGQPECSHWEWHGPQKGDVHGDLPPV